MLSLETLEKISQQLYESTGLRDWFVSGAKIHARRSIIYQARHPRFSGTVAVKRYYKHLYLKDKYKNFNELSERMNAPGLKYRVPKLYGYLNEEHIILMEWVAAPNLKQQLWSHFYQHKFQQKKIHQTFVWLQHFHQERGLSQAVGDLTIYKKLLQEAMNKHPDVTALLQKKDGVFNQALEIFTAACERWQGLEVSHSQIHSDFIPSNVLLNNKQVVGIDFWSDRFAPVADDLTRMLTHIGIGFPNMITKGDIKSGKSYTQWPLVKLLVDAYSYPLHDLEQQKFFLLMWQYQLLRRRIVVASRLKASKQEKQEDNMRQSRMMDQWVSRKTRFILKQVTVLLKE